MSAGPISYWWRSHRPPTESTADANRICAVLGKDNQRSYCGRSKKSRKDISRVTGIARNAAGWGTVECTDCQAARRADLEDQALKKEAARA